MAESASKKLDYYSILTGIKDWGIKKETKVDAYISDNFSHISTNFVPQKRKFFLAFHRDALYYCVFIMREIPAILAMLVRN